MSKTFLGSVDINSNGMAQLIFKSTGRGDITVIAESEGLTSNEVILHDYLYAPPFTSEHPTPTSGLGSNVQRDNNDCLTVVHQSIWDNPSTPWIHINIKKTAPTTLIVTKTGDTANNGTVTFTNCELLDSYEKMSVGATSNGGSVIGKLTFKNFRVKRIGD